MKLAIITINYNDFDGLQKTINSIKDQSFKDFEHIIIDGGSSDESVNYIKDYHSHGLTATKWVSEKDNGVYDAQNKGIKLAQGDYCIFMNAGDYFINNFVLEQVFVQADDSDIIWGNLIVTHNNKIVEKCKGKTDVSFIDIYNSIIKHQASFIKRSLFEKYGLYDTSLKIVADWAFFFKVAGFHDVSLCYVNVDIAFFNNDGISYHNPKRCNLERQKVLDQYMSKRLQADYLIFNLYPKIKYIEPYKVGYKLIRLIAKISNTLYVKKSQ